MHKEILILYSYNYNLEMDNNVKEREEQAQKEEKHGIPRKGIRLFISISLNIFVCSYFSHICSFFIFISIFM